MNSCQSTVASQQPIKRFQVASYKLQGENQNGTGERCSLSVIGRRIKSRLWVSLLIVMMLLIVGCTNNAVSLATFTPPAVQPKLLVTVYLSPTPNAEQQQALAAANPPTATPAVIPTATVTPYVGVFLGEVDSGSEIGRAHV